MDSLFPTHRGFVQSMSHGQRRQILTLLSGAGSSTHLAT